MAYDHHINYLYNHTNDYISNDHNYIILVGLAFLNSSSQIRLNGSLFEENIIINPIIIGDLNARIGEYCQHLNEIYEELFDAGLEERKSKDQTINGNGRKLLELCDNNNLLILNGRTRGDADGDLTFISSTGGSVNDICAVFQDALKLVEEFRVGDETWSDHLPITLIYKVPTECKAKKTLNLLPKLQWNDEDTENYKIRINQNLHNLVIANNDPTLGDLAKVISESSRQQIYRNKTFNPKHKWYNFQCHNARNKMFNLLKNHKSINTADSKEKYLSAVKKYKAICKKSKKKYSEELLEKINNVWDSKQWWKVAREIRNDSYNISLKISSTDFREYFKTLLNPEKSVVEIHYAPNYYVDPFLDCDISLTELKAVLKKLKINKAPGEDRISYEHIVNAPENFHLQLLKRYNNILETGDIDSKFAKSIIFPIHKKGDITQPKNYRGVAFMNCLAKIMMGVLNERLANWTEHHRVLNEFQAGFRKGYSTIDNIYNLTSIVSLRYKERKKTYAFFVDFKAAFDNVCRKSLIYKLHQLGISYKFIKVLENIYSNTEYAIWTGEELSEYFETNSGVKQGCLLSPLLFALYINDLHDFLQGGINTHNMNIRILLYADDIVILAEDISTMQSMISRLENYCDLWNLTVNMEKSEIMIFRNGGRLSRNEEWFYKGNIIKIAKEYNYLGVTLTPRMKFLKHVEKRTAQSKTAINVTWASLIDNKEVNYHMKWKLYQAVCRAIQSYAAQVWGFSYFEAVDKLQRYFLKKTLKLPSFTPNYALMLETDIENSHLYTLNLHLQYIHKTLYQFEDHRLPKIMTKLLIQEEVFWVRDVKNMAQNLNLVWPNTNLRSEWESFCTNIIKYKHMDGVQSNLRRKSQKTYNVTTESKIERMKDGNIVTTNPIYEYKAQRQHLQAYKAFID
ncbi:uncharacterized protein LOC142233513 [Haematobia irritans]|uniref:uncharacterized protein LOC142233513 n=1 Tax=Haematobia irritans TaxID=7368 RepID=UPI003F50C40D